jgi:hypothetical protein
MKGAQSASSSHLALIMTMSRLLLLPFAVGILTGCTSLVTSYNRIRAALTEGEEPEESHYYGAYFTSSPSLAPELPSEWSGPHFRRYPKAKSAADLNALR